MTAPRSLSFDDLTAIAKAASLRADAEAREHGVLPAKAGVVRKLTATKTPKVAAKRVRAEAKTQVGARRA